MDQDKYLEALQEELEELQNKYDFLLSAVDHLPNPIFMKDDQARFFFFNKAYSDFFDMKAEDYYGTTVLDLDYLPLEDRERFQIEDLRRIADKSVISYDTVFTTGDNVDHPSFYWSCGFHDDKSGRQGLVGEIVDISKERALQDSLDESLGKLQNANEMLKTMAETDHASGLYNRSVLWDKGKSMIERTSMINPATCMIMIDLDNFKDVNDEFGHLKGDEALAKFAGILKSECRSTDLPVRYGGDEFLVVVYNIGLEECVKVAERIKTRCEEELIMPDGSNITASIGVIEIDDNEEFEKNLTRLDDQLYKAKALGRNRVVYK